MSPPHQTFVRDLLLPLPIGLKHRPLAPPHQALVRDLLLCPSTNHDSPAVATACALARGLCACSEVRTLLESVF